jgi:transcriptional regulator with XRE-family HTH domain
MDPQEHHDVNRRFRLALLDSQIDTIENLSAITKIERSRLSRISNGRIKPTRDELQRLSKTFRRDARRLLPAGAVTLSSEPHAERDRGHDK